ncbi:hypothetical protein G7Y89_g9141 [Cudoniella acicularis]|uniref:DNA primase n=1 Tax=Cudoniella acicularis TaxID=354080 RepID=A0A8H4VZX3_9HELO|nr:hypothetical protein G7Y89_g9141 [Cudoniella acicularis]
MPHSISPEAKLSAQDETTIAEGAADGETQSSENTLVADSPTDDVMEQDMTMEDVGMQGEAAPTAPVKTETHAEVKLEDLFADVESDEEFPSSNGQNIEISGSLEAPSSPVHNGPSSRASDTDVMRSFYQRLFPWRYLFQWLNHSPTPSSDFGHREFAFTLQNDIYLRYQSFPTSDLLRKDVLRLMPSRFEIGPIYTTNPRDRKTLRKASAFKPLAKEMCFDIDLTDYDDIRTCCDKANICIKCWQFITMAIKVIDIALREDFGFKHIMRSLEILRSHFQSDILQDQDPWETDDKFDHLLQLLPDRVLNDALRKKWSSAPGRASTAKWADIDALARSGASKTLDTRALKEAKEDIVLEYTYPRLDIEVSKKLNHLLKSPFVVHPKTGRVCVPIDPKNLDDFDPLDVPTVTGLLEEIDKWTAPEGEKEGKPVQDWEKTSIKPYVEHFRSLVMALMRDEKDVKIKRERDDNDADAMEF